MENLYRVYSTCPILLYIPRTKQYYRS